MLDMLFGYIVFILLAIIVPIGLHFFYKKKGAQEKKTAIASLAKQRESEERLRIEEYEYHAVIDELVSTYGDCTLNVFLGPNPHSISSYVYFFEKGQMMVLQGEHIPFERIIGFSLNDDTETIMKNEMYSSTTTTSTGSLLGRAVVGGVLLGGFGAIAGATTAKKETVSTPLNDETRASLKHKYTLYINIDSISNPLREIGLAEDTQKAQILTNVINVIVQRKTK